MFTCLRPPFVFLSKLAGPALLASSHSLSFKKLSALKDCPWPLSRFVGLRLPSNPVKVWPSKNSLRRFSQAWLPCLKRLTRSCRLLFSNRSTPFKLSLTDANGPLDTLFWFSPSFIDPYSRLDAYLALPFAVLCPSSVNLQSLVTFALLCVP